MTKKELKKLRYLLRKYVMDLKIAEIWERISILDEQGRRIGYENNMKCIGYCIKNGNSYVDGTIYLNEVDAESAVEAMKKNPIEAIKTTTPKLK